MLFYCKPYFFFLHGWAWLAQLLWMTHVRTHAPHPHPHTFNFSYILWKMHINIVYYILVQNIKIDCELQKDIN